MNQPLVTVCVVCYNSAKFVVETLESIKAQSYQNIELIISDDCSSDNTVDLCNEWLAENKERFVRAEVITTEKNTGVTDNCNRGLDASTGEWWKIIAGDDILSVDCVQNFIEYVSNHKDAKFVFANEIEFRGPFENQDFTPRKLQLRSFFFRQTMTAHKQFLVETKMFVGSSPASFANTDTLRSIGGFDSRFPMHEDTPLFIRLPKCGVRLWYMDEYVVYRRIWDNSITHDKDQYAIVSKFRCRDDTFSEYRKENSTFFWKIAADISKQLTTNVIQSGNDRRILKCRVYDFCRRWFNPYKWYFIYALAADKFYSVINRKNNEVFWRKSCQ